MKKGFGIIRLIAAMLAGHVEKPKGSTTESLVAHKTRLLTNGYAAPIPGKHLNQRQKRKRGHWAGVYSR